MFGQVDQPLRREEARADQVRIVRVLDAGDVGQLLGPKQVDPLAVGSVRHHFVVAAVAREHRPVGRHVEVHGPFVALEVVPRPPAGRDLVGGQPEILAPRRLQVVPDGPAVGAEEFVAGDLHVHGAGVDLGPTRAVGADRPDAVDLMPGTLVTEHDEAGVGGRKLEVAEPFALPAHVLELAGPGVDREDHVGRAGVNPRELIVQHQFLGLRVGHGFPVGSGRLVVGLLEARIRPRHAAPRAAPVPATGTVVRRFGPLDIGAQQQRLVGVERGHHAAGRQLHHLPCFQRRHIGRVNHRLCHRLFRAVRLGRLLRHPFRVVDVARFVAGDEHSCRPGDHFLDFPGGQVDGGDPVVPVADRNDQVLAVCRVGVLVEIEAGRAGFAGKADDAVPGVGIDPLGGRLVRGGRGLGGVRRGQAGRGEAEQQA